MIEQKFADLFAAGSQVSLDIAEREITLTYVLKILEDAGFLKTLIFKGGTCLRKCVYGKETRFSMDLDFTSATTLEPEDVILELVSVFSKPAHGLSFEVDAKDFYAAEDKLSCGAIIQYKHPWAEGKFKLDLSLREKSSLEPVAITLKPQAYFKHLEFKPFPVACLQFEELLAEKIRAAYQRARARDLYDLVRIAENPLNIGLIKTLVVIKCWNVRDVFDPEAFFRKLKSGKYDWDGLKQLVRRGEKINPEKMIETCEKRYQILRRLTADEARLAADAKRHNLKNLPNILLALRNK
ncbi:MAG: nucleotidyl transferase AbiEii/AbiGii toxin family protein [Elusimicrobia bacterium]|nr:nucleotidyl transferase AbiEii/AbiGii toxin family protein [Elusimicrobiota bacterium]